MRLRLALCVAGRRKSTPEMMNRQAVLLMRRLKAGEEAVHEAARRLERNRPEMTQHYFSLGRRSFALLQTMQREWDKADDDTRRSYLDEAARLARELDSL
jgi:hypothetical protein